MVYACPGTVATFWPRKFGPRPMEKLPALRASVTYLFGTRDGPWLNRTRGDVAARVGIAVVGRVVIKPRVLDQIHIGDGDGVGKGKDGQGGKEKGGTVHLDLQRVLYGTILGLNHPLVSETTRLHRAQWTRSLPQGAQGC
jgi:hypothetical protein